MRAGRLRERITLRRQADVSDGAGGWTRGWTTVAANIPAEVIGQSGRESMITNTLQGVATYRIAIRWVTGANVPKVDDQLLWHAPGGDVELNVVAPPVDRYGNRSELQIFADTSAPENV